MDDPGIVRKIGEFGFLNPTLDEMKMKKKHYKGVLQTMQTTLGTDHPTNLVIVERFAYIYAYIGKFDDALLLFKRLYVWQATTVDQDNLDALETSQHLATVHMNLDQLDEALEPYEEASQGYINFLAPMHQHILETEYG
ncbi:hypothetical protein K470DRAFT_267996 [Piedraia hortae CBS 480.64]|uniref:TPR-like protein n=1 Tax=Piedraia hortae CBS 480.64 TaxID=1314780 RepID=A0A6A7C831_9PEZI|nr:hypothetical protein K470DRAFT_267996 [Piedraia hortae CBS 480.64]